MKPPKARMDELAEKLGILEAGREEVSAVSPNDKQKKPINKVLGNTKKSKSENREIALVLNPPHGEKDDFAKITVTLPRPVRQLLLNESHWRKTKRESRLVDLCHRAGSACGVSGKQAGETFIKTGRRAVMVWSAGQSFLLTGLIGQDTHGPKSAGPASSGR